MSSNSRFQVVEPGSAALPANCAVCGSIRRPLVDFGMTLDFYGAVYICTECMADGAKAMGYQDEEKLRLEEQLHAAVAGLDKASRRMVAGLSELHNIVSTTIADANSIIDPAGVVFKEPSSSPDTSDDGDGKEAELAVGQDVSSARNEGSSSVPSSSSNERNDTTGRNIFG
jgi:hypothetical protein